MCSRRLRRRVCIVRRIILHIPHVTCVPHIIRQLLRRRYHMHRCRLLLFMLRVRRRIMR